MDPSKKRATNSPVWEHFKRKDGGAICSFCKAFIKIVNNTSNILNHLRKRHPDQWEIIKQNNPKYWTETPVSRIKVEIPGQEPVSMDISEGNDDSKDKEVDVYVSPRKKSVTWEYFERINDNGICKCHLCGLLIKSFNTTSNLFVHLKNRHIAEWRAIKGINTEEIDPKDLIEYDDKMDDSDNADNKGVNSLHVRRIYKSPAWRFYELTPDGCKCTLCGKFLKAYSSTSNLINHLRNKHLSHYKSIQSMCKKQPKTAPTYKEVEPVYEQIAEDLIFYEPVASPQSPSVLPLTPTPKEKSPKSDSMELLINFIVTDEMPINITELKGFRQILLSQIPNLEMPTQTGLRQILENKYMESTYDTKNQMELASCFSLAISEWTDIRNSRNIIGISCHYIYQATLKSAIIGVEELIEGLTEDLLVQKIELLLQLWHIEGAKVQSVVVTGETAMITNIFTKMFGSEKIITCFAHGLNFIAKKPFEALTELHIILDATKQIIDSLKNGDEIMVEDYEEGQQFWDMVYTTPTTWKGLLEQMENFIKFSDKIETVFLEQGNEPAALTDDTIVEIKDIIKVYKPLIGVVSELIQEDRLSASKVIPLVQCLVASLTDTRPKTQVGINTKQLMLDQIATQFSDIEQNDIFSLATLIDPRFKKNYFKDKKTREAIVSKIKENFIIPNDQFIEEEVKEEDGSIWKFHMSMVESQSEVEQHPITIFLSTKVASLKDTQPIEYFSTNHGELRAGAEKLLISTANCTPSRIIFSEAGNTINSNWASLPVHDLRRLMFLKSVMK